MDTYCKYRKVVIVGADQLTQPAVERSIQILNDDIASLNNVEIAGTK